jgi:hypothetical protein
MSKRQILIRLEVKIQTHLKPSRVEDAHTKRVEAQTGEAGSGFISKSEQSDPDSHQRQKIRIRIRNTLLLEA